MATNRSYKKQRLSAAMKQGGRCFYCGRMMTPPDHTELTSMTVDHIKPRMGRPTRAGLSGGFVVACKSCNLARGHAQFTHHLFCLNASIVCSNAPIFDIMAYEQINQVRVSVL